MHGGQVVFALMVRAMLLRVVLSLKVRQERSCQQPRVSSMCCGPVSTGVALLSVQDGVGKLGWDGRRCCEHPSAVSTDH